MEYLIDGNNLLYTAHSHGPAPAIGRERLCELVGRWAKRTTSRVTMIFDGPPPAPAFHQQMRAAGIEVLFSAPRSADEVIEDRIASAPLPVELCIVTSDHAIQSAARARRCRYVESDAFVEELFAPPLPPAAPPPPPSAPPEKPSGPSPGESDGWLRQFDYDPDEPPDETDLMRY